VGVGGFQFVAIKKKFLHFLLFLSIAVTTEGLKRKKEVELTSHEKWVYLKVKNEQNKSNVMTE